VSVLGKKLGRDLWRLKGQVITIALVLACGIMSMVMLRGAFASLLGARDEYYARERFADVFARLERAPEVVAGRLAAVPGVARVYTRVVEDVMLALPDEPDPIGGRVVSIPGEGEAPLCGVTLVAGRMPAPGATDEVIVLEQFAVARGLHPDDRLPVVLNGALRQLRIVGIGLSPEYVFAVSGKEIVADDKGFVVLWMPRPALAPTFRMEGAFNDALISLQPGASVPAVLDAVDRELAAYGGRHAVGRDRQMSHYALTSELDQLRTMALLIPGIFLAVAAFLVNVVISRLVYLERPQIAILKALGRRRLEIALHYLGLVVLIVAVGSVLGVALGVWSGRWMTNLYAGFFHFPGGRFRLGAEAVAISVGVALIAAVAGALGAVARVSRLPAAEAMRPPTPPTYRRSFGGFGRFLGPAAMMIFRDIVRRPLRFLMSTAAIALGVGIFVLGRFQWDSFDRVMNEDFVSEHRGDLEVSFARSLPARAVRALGDLPGVELAEGSRAVGVRFHNGALWRDAAILGLPVPSELRRLHDHRTTEVTPPAVGLLMTAELARILEVGPGDEIDAEILEGSWPTRRVTVTALIEEPFGLQAYARNDWLDALLREEPRVTSASLRVDPAQLDRVRARLKEMPAVIATGRTAGVVERYRAQTGRSIGVITLILTLSAAAISIGVVYNNARIALAQRGRDLASLRVLGFTRREISTILLGELGSQVVAGVLLGIPCGWGLAHVIASASSSEAMRFPFYVAPATYAAGALIAILAGVVSALLVRRQLDRLDLIAVLKATE
jgi:putative ABC transport system permease protein